MCRARGGSRAAPCPSPCPGGGWCWPFAPGRLQPRLGTCQGREDAARGGAGGGRSDAQELLTIYIHTYTPYRRPCTCMGMHSYAPIYIHRYDKGRVFPQSSVPGREKALCRSQPQIPGMSPRGEPRSSPGQAAFPAGTALGDPADKGSSVRIRTPAPREPREFSTSARLHEKEICTSRHCSPRAVRDTLTFPLPGEGI